LPGERARDVGKLAFRKSRRARRRWISKLLGKQAAELKIYPALPPLDKKTDMSVAERLDKTPWAFDPKTVTAK
jgi:hypothetical protein